MIQDAHTAGATSASGRRLSVDEASRLTGVCPQTIRRAIAGGRLAAAQPGGSKGRIFISPEALEKWANWPAATAPVMSDRNQASTRRKRSWAAPREAASLIGDNFDDEAIKAYVLGDHLSSPTSRLHRKA